MEGFGPSTICSLPDGPPRGAASRVPCQEIERICLSSTERITAEIPHQTHAWNTVSSWGRPDFSRAFLSLANTWPPKLEESFSWRRIWRQQPRPYAMTSINSTRFECLATTPDVIAASVRDPRAGRLGGGGYPRDGTGSSGSGRKGPSRSAQVQPPVPGLPPGRHRSVWAVLSFESRVRIGGCCFKSGLEAYCRGLVFAVSCQPPDAPYGEDPGS